ncbi:MAG: DUF2974 domain-containing protein [Blautia sp.]|nr:DUF2974 domain-containing protein [Blautia sp.]MCM1199772.1 DUF2974 domain-containing protein [Bacteroides fragilis]
MGTILDYIKEYGDYTFSEKPFSEVDSLILCQFAYLKFDGLVPGIDDDAPPVSIRQVFENQNYDNLYGDERYREKNTGLFLAMMRSRRFGGLKMNYYVNQIELEKETQFSAITFQPDDGLVYAAYRGTDETIVGWKEDLNLAFSEPVPGQVMSVEYLEKSAEKTGRPFYMGGHSKGGNFAVYAAMNCRREVRDKIVIIFNHDGPGFRPEVRERGNFAEIESRIRRTVPHSSMVGMLLSSEGSCRVVESRNFGLAQHDPYSWLVEKDDFQIVKQVYSGRMFVDTALNDWILSLNQEQMHVFVDTLYDVVKASEADNLIDFTANWKRSIQGIMSAIKNVDTDTTKIMNDIMKALFERLSQHTKEELQGKAKTGRRRLP